MGKIYEALKTNNTYLVNLAGILAGAIFYVHGYATGNSAAAFPSECLLAWYSWSDMATRALSLSRKGLSERIVGFFTGNNLEARATS